MPKTLYVTDLDGTLLQNDQTISPFSVQTIQAFIRGGGLFSYATARSHVSAGRVTQALGLRLPVIIYNGTFIVAPDTGAPVWAGNFAEGVAEAALNSLVAAGVHPIVYSHIDGREYSSWIPQHLTEGCLRYVADRPGDPRNRPVADLPALLAGDVFYMMVIVTEAKLQALLPLFTNNPALQVHTLEDSYHPGDFWLELSPVGTGKDHMLLRLKEMIGADRIVCFGDNLNDMPMFRVADEAYAVANAKAELKALATGIIGSNTEDGVARFLMDVR